MAEKNTADIGFEKQIWNAACVLRGNMDASEYKGVVLGLIFLKYISDRFEDKYNQLVADGDGFEEDRDEYTSEGIFFVPAGARWSDVSAKAHDPEITVYGKACPLFVPLVEEGWLKDPVTEEVARRYLKELLEKDIDSLILGCTHYPLIRSLMRKIVGDKVQLVNPAYETALELGRLLTREGLANDGGTDCAGEKYQFFVSDAAEKFAEFANSILPYDVKKTRKINIEEYGA